MMAVMMMMMMVMQSRSDSSNLGRGRSPEVAAQVDLVDNTYLLTGVLYFLEFVLAEFPLRE